MTSNAVLKYSALSLVLVAVFSAYTDRALQDQITHLPGAEALEITFNQFSGYIDGMLLVQSKFNIFKLLVRFIINCCHSSWQYEEAALLVR